MPLPPIIPASASSSAGPSTPSATSSGARLSPPPTLSRTLLSNISTMHSRLNKVLGVSSPMRSSDLPTAKAAVQTVVSDASIPTSRPLPAPLRTVLSAAINPQMQLLAKKCHSSEHYSLLLGWIYQLAPLLTDQCIALEWWDFLIKPVLRDPTSSEVALEQAKSLVLEVMCSTPADAYQDVEPPNTPWPKIENVSAGNFSRKVGDAPYSTFASGPAPVSNKSLRTPGSSTDSVPSPSFESSATTFRRRMEKQNSLHRFTGRIVQLYFFEIASVPQVEPATQQQRSRTRQSSGASAGVLQIRSGDGGQAPDLSKAARDLSGLGLTGIGGDERLPKQSASEVTDGDHEATAPAVTADVGAEPMEEEEEPSESSQCWTQRLEDLVLAFGKRAPKHFFHHLSSCFAEPTNRIPVLVNLIAFISANPSSAYHLIATPLPAEVLMSLQIDTSTTVISLGVRLVVMLLPHIPMWFANGGGGGLPALMAIFARVIDWRIFGNGWEERVNQASLGSDAGSVAGDSLTASGGDGAGGGGADTASSQGHDGAGHSAVSLNDEIINKKAALDIEWMELDRIGKRLVLREDVQWSRLTSIYDTSDISAPDAVLLFTYLYGLFPANSIRFLRAPVDYLRKAHYVSPSAASYDDLIDELTIHDRCTDIVRRHRLHEGLVTHSAEWEVCSTERWKKSVTEEYAAVCINHYLDSTDGARNLYPSAHSVNLTDRLLRGDPRSGADTPTANAGTLSSEVAASIAMKPTLSTSSNLLTPAMSISSAKGMSAVHRENLLLRSELNYEMNLKGQLLHFIGKLHRDKLKSHVLAAEQQNLKSEVKVLRSELDRSRKERDKIREEADKRAKRLGNPQQRLRDYMEKNRRTTEELQRLTVELQDQKETNAALSAQLESVGTELFEIKATWRQHEPALQELENLKAHVAKMQDAMKAWADTEAKYEAQAAELRLMASKWTQMELERDAAEASAREAFVAREEAEVERQRWASVAEESAAQLKSLQSKWTMKPPLSSSHFGAQQQQQPQRGDQHHHHGQHSSLTPTAAQQMYNFAATLASGAVFSASSPSSPLLQATNASATGAGAGSGASRRQSMIQAASARLLVGNVSAASALLGENVRLNGAVEEMQAEILELRAELALARQAQAQAQSQGQGGSASGSVGGRSSRTAGRRGSASVAVLEDVDVLPLDIGPAATGLESQRAQQMAGKQDAAPQEVCPDYVFSTVRVLGGALPAEEHGGDGTSLVQRLLPPQLRAVFAERVEARGTAETVSASTEREANVVRRIPLLASHLARLRDSRASMRQAWPNAWTASEASLADSELNAKVLSAIAAELERQEAVLVGREGSDFQDLRLRIELHPNDEVKVTSAPAPRLAYDRDAGEVEGEAAGRPKVRLDTAAMDLFSALRGHDDLRAAMSSCKTSRREAYVAAASRLNANYGADSASDEGGCFDGLLWVYEQDAKSDDADSHTRRLITESTIANVVLEVEGSEGQTRWITPALGGRRDGEPGEVRFLPGLLRNELVRLGVVEEEDIAVETVLQLLKADGGAEAGTSEGLGSAPVRLWLCNAFRGLFEVELVA